MTENDKLLYCQVIAQLLLIDGAVTDEERAFLFRLMDRFEFTSAQRADVFNHVNIDDEIEEKIAQISDEARGALLVELDEAAMADGDIGPAERALIQRVTEAMA